MTKMKKFKNSLTNLFINKKVVFRICRDKIWARGWRLRLSAFPVLLIYRPRVDIIILISLAFFILLQIQLAAKCGHFYVF